MPERFRFAVSTWPQKSSQDNLVRGVILEKVVSRAFRVRCAGWGLTSGKGSE